VYVTDTRRGTEAAGVSGPADLASYGRRLGALVVDWVLCLLVGGLFGAAARYPWLPVLVLVVEYGLFLGLFGQTPGMRLTRIRCASVTDGGVVGVPRALLRGLLLVLVVPALFLDSYGRGLHDKAARSVMLAAPVERA
jgi:hypothetical protein